MSRISPFFPIAVVNITAAAASQNAKLLGVDVADLSGNSPAPRAAARAGQSVKIDITGTVTGPVFIKFGDITVLATTNDIPVVQNPDSFFMTIPISATHIAVIPTGADVPVVRITIGAGGV